MPEKALTRKQVAKLAAETMFDQLTQELGEEVASDWYSRWFRDGMQLLLRGDSAVPPQPTVKKRIPDGWRVVQGGAR